MALSSKAKQLVYQTVRFAHRATHQKLPADFLAHCNNFLILQYTPALGAAVHATPLIEALRQAKPSARIVIAANGFNADIYQHNPHVERVLITPSPLKDVRGALHALRQQTFFEAQPFIALTPIGSERTPIAWNALWCGASARAGFTVAPLWYEQPVKYIAELSQIANNLRIVQALGHPLPQHCEPRIVPGPEDQQKAIDLLPADTSFAVFVTQNSPTQRKGWRPERFRDVAQHFHQQHGLHILYVGTQAERAAIEQLRAFIDTPSTNIAGLTSIRELTAIFQRCRIAVTLDTGPLHVARAAGLPSVIIAPAWSPEHEWLPVQHPNYRILKNATIPSPPPDDYIIDEVSVDDVIRAAEELLSSEQRID